MKILITGGQGFIGQNLCEQLPAHYSILAPSHAELELLDEHRVAEYLKFQNPDVVIHCANVGATRRTDNLPQIVGNNLRMFLNLANNEKYFKKMIFFGSGAEFDKRQPLVKIGETFHSENLPESDYGFSKALCSHFIAESNKIINLRIFGVYGRHDDYENRFISNAISRAVLGLPLVVFQDQVMSFVFVDDLVKIVNHFICTEMTEKFYHCASSQDFSLLEIAEKIKKLSGKDLPILIKKSGQANEYTCNNSRLLKELGDFQFTDMEQSLKVLLDWYIKRQSLIDPTKLTV